MKKDYIFKRVCETDAPVLCSLYAQLTGERPDEELTRSSLKAIADDSNYFVFGAYDKDGALVGNVTLSRCIDLTDDGRSYFSLENFVIDEKYRRKGIGKYLLEQAESFACTENARYVGFLSAARRTDAHAFYEAMGYPLNYVKGFKKVLPKRPEN